MNTSRSSTATISQKILKALKLERPWFHKVARYTWIAFFCLMLGFPLYVLSVSADLFGLYGPMPSIREVENPENDLSSELISADGVSLGRYFRYNRSQVNYNELSEELRNALLISEDHRFHDHSGLDFIGGGNLWAMSDRRPIAAAGMARVPGSGGNRGIAGPARPGSGAA